MAGLRDLPSSFTTPLKALAKGVGRASCQLRHAYAYGSQYTFQRMQQYRVRFMLEISIARARIELGTEGEPGAREAHLGLFQQLDAGPARVRG